MRGGRRGGGGGVGGGGKRAYKRQFTVFLIVIIEAIYRNSVTRTVKLAGSSYRAGRLCIIILMIWYDL